MRVLVTGGGGFLGSVICRQLMEKNYDVHSLSRNIYPHLEKMGVTQIKGDIRLLSDVKKALTGIDAIIHTAAKADIWGATEDFEAINVKGTENLLQAASEEKIKYFIYTSSPSTIYPGHSIEGVDETTPYPEYFFCDYARTKAIAEKKVLEFGKRNIFKTVVIRPHLIWGEGDPHILPRLTEKAQKKKLKIIGDGKNLVDVIHVENAAYAHVLALTKLIEGKSISGQVYFVGQERPVVLWDFINQMLATQNISPVVKAVPFNVAFAIGNIAEKIYRSFQLKKHQPPMTRFVALQMSTSHYFSHKKAENDLDYFPLISIEEGLVRLKI